MNIIKLQVCMVFINLILTYSDFVSQKRNYCKTTIKHLQTGSLLMSYGRRNKDIYKYTYYKYNGWYSPTGLTDSGGVWDPDKHLFYNLAV